MPNTTQVVSSFSSGHFVKQKIKGMTVTIRNKITKQPLRDRLMQIKHGGPLCYRF